MQTTLDILLALVIPHIQFVLIHQSAYGEGNFSYYKKIADTAALHLKATTVAATLAVGADIMVAADFAHLGMQKASELTVNVAVMLRQLLSVLVQVTV